MPTWVATSQKLQRHIKWTDWASQPANHQPSLSYVPQLPLQAMLNNALKGLMMFIRVIIGNPLPLTSHFLYHLSNTEQKHSLTATISRQIAGGTTLEPGGRKFYAAALVLSRSSS